jgi:hypothetical protein
MSFSISIKQPLRRYSKVAHHILYFKNSKQKTPSQNIYWDKLVIFIYIRVTYVNGLLLWIKKLDEGWGTIGRCRHYSLGWSFIPKHLLLCCVNRQQHDAVELKGTVSRDFLSLVFSSNNFLWSQYASVETTLSLVECPWSYSYSYWFPSVFTTGSRDFLVYPSADSHFIKF